MGTDDGPQCSLYRASQYVPMWFICILFPWWMAGFNAKSTPIDNSRCCVWDVISSLHIKYLFSTYQKSRRIVTDFKINSWSLPSCQCYSNEIQKPPLPISSLILYNLLILLKLFTSLLIQWNLCNPAPEFSDIL